MKYLISTIIGLLASLSMMAQIVLVPGKFTTADGKGFVVVEHEGTQAELFDKVKSKLTTIYVNPDRVISENKPQVISINGMTSDIVLKMGMAKGCPLINYKINVYFKDGKIRFDAPIVVGTIRDKFHAQTTYLLDAANMSRTSSIYTFFKKDGKARDKAHVQAVEDYFNNLILAITKDLDSKDGAVPEDW